MSLQYPRELGLGGSEARFSLGQIPPLLFTKYYKDGLMVLTKTHGLNLDSLYWTVGSDKGSWYRHRLMLLTRTHGIDMKAWYII